MTCLVRSRRTRVCSKKNSWFFTATAVYLSDDKEMPGKMNTELTMDDCIEDQGRTSLWIFYQN